jgi:hypothetical protein
MSFFITEKKRDEVLVFHAAEAGEKTMTRFAGFAVLPVGNPQAAADEL